MAYIIFEFNNNKFRLEKSDLEVEEIFGDLTGIKIEKQTSDTKPEQKDNAKKTSSSETLKAIKHPLLEDIIDLFKAQTNFEYGTELIREKFYPDLSKEEWRKVYYSIYPKINNAMKVIEEEERGKFIKRKDGKFTIYSFVKDNIPSLSEYNPSIE